MIPYYGISWPLLLLMRLSLCALVLVLVGAQYTNPVIHGDFPDPGAAYSAAERLYWVAATSGDSPDRFALHAGPTLTNWTARGSVFPKGAAGAPAWAVSDFWAPELHLVNGAHLVYFVARNRQGMLSVGAAVSHAGIGGPYADIGHELVTTADLGMIDPTYYDDNGTGYLIWKACVPPAGAHHAGRCQRPSALQRRLPHEYLPEPAGLDRHARAAAARVVGCAHQADPAGTSTWPPIDQCPHAAR